MEKKINVTIWNEFIHECICMLIFIYSCIHIVIFNPSPCWALRCDECCEDTVIAAIKESEDILLCTCKIRTGPWHILIVGILHIDNKHKILHDFNIA